MKNLCKNVDVTFLYSGFQVEDNSANLLRIFLDIFITFFVSYLRLWHGKLQKLDKMVQGVTVYLIQTLVRYFEKKYKYK